MNDFERLMRESLKSVGEEYKPSDPVEAKHRFMQRRRRRIFRFVASGVAAAGVAVAAALFFLSSPASEPEHRVPVVGAREARIAARVEVGERPSGIAVGDGYVWVTNIASNTLTQIDPATNTEVDSTVITGGPDDVLVVDEHVWVATEAGRLWSLSIETGVLSDTRGVGSGGHLDIAGEGEDLFVQETGGPLYRMDASTGDVVAQYETGADATDVTIQGDLLWVYDRAEGNVLQLDRATGDTLAEVEVGVTESQDLAASEDYVWFFRGSDAALLQIDVGGSIVSESELSGTFGAISPTSDGVWVMTTSGGPQGTGRGTLYRIDPQRAQQIGTSVPLIDVPYDVAAGDGAIWITNNSGGTVTRIDITPVDDELEPVATDDEVVFYYAADGDIFAQRADGTSEAVIDTPAFETNPTLSPSGKTLVYQRGRAGSPDTELWVLALEDDVYDAGINDRLMQGESPAYGPNGELAWVVTGTGPDDPTMLGVGPIGSEPRLMIPVSPNDAVPFAISKLAWSGGGNAIHYIAYGTRYEAAAFVTGVGTADDPDPQRLFESPPGELISSIAAAEDGALVGIRLCCVTPPEFEFTTAELVRLGEDDAEKMAGLDDFMRDPSPSMFVTSAGTLDYETDIGWTRGADPSWLIGDGQELWLLTATREPNRLAPTAVDAVAIVPGALDDD